MREKSPLGIGCAAYANSGKSTVSGDRPAHEGMRPGLPLIVFQVRIVLWMLAAIQRHPRRAIGKHKSSQFAKTRTELERKTICPEA